jgi:hypothetical protein
MRSAERLHVPDLRGAGSPGQQLRHGLLLRLRAADQAESADPAVADVGLAQGGEALRQLRVVTG